MGGKQEFWTEARLKKGIIAFAIGIVIIIVATFGWWYWLNKPEGSTPPVLQRAIDEAEAKVKKNPSDLDARTLLVQLLIQDKQYDDAMIECKILLKSDKENELVYALMGVIEDEEGNDKAAIKNYQKAIDLGEKKKMSQLNPAIVESRFRMGKIFLDQKKYDNALLQFQLLADQNAMDADSRYFLGLTFLKMGAYDKAIEWEEAATRYVPDYYEAFYVLGQAYEKKGNKQKAIAAYEQALKAKSDYEEAQDALDKLK